MPGLGRIDSKPLGGLAEAPVLVKQNVPDVTIYQPPTPDDFHANANNYHVGPVDEKKSGSESPSDFYKNNVEVADTPL